MTAKVSCNFSTLFHLFFVEISLRRTALKIVSRYPLTTAVGRQLLRRASAERPDQTSSYTAPFGRRRFQAAVTEFSFDATQIKCHNTAPLH